MFDYIYRFPQDDTVGQFYVSFEDMTILYAWNFSTGVSIVVWSTPKLPSVSSQMF